MSDNQQSTETTAQNNAKTAGSPSGRPRTRTLSQILREQAARVEQDGRTKAEHLLDRVLQQAKEGDRRAARLVPRFRKLAQLSRIWAAARR
jgi:hypothetical protein